MWWPLQVTAFLNPWDPFSTGFDYSVQKYTWGEQIIPEHVSDLHPIEGWSTQVDINLFAKLMVAFRPQGIGYSCWKVHVDMQIEYRNVAARCPLTFFF